MAVAEPEEPEALVELPAVLAPELLDPDVVEVVMVVEPVVEPVVMVEPEDVDDMEVDGVEEENEAEVGLSLARVTLNWADWARMPWFSGEVERRLIW